MPFDLSMGEILVVLFVALLVFGGKLPEMARKIGSAFREFKQGMREELRKVELGIRNDEGPPQWKPPAKPSPPPADSAPPAPQAPEAPQAQSPAPAEPTRRDP